MCGLAGIVAADRHARVNEGILLAMRDVQVHRGPDEGGLFVNSTEAPRHLNHNGTEIPVRHGPSSTSAVPRR